MNTDFGVALPPFPDDIPTHPLLIIDYAKVDSQVEKDKLWEAATKLGFWYLKNHGTEVDVGEMFHMGEETMALPMGEKIKFEQGDAGVSFGYKAAGANATDASGRLDTVEFINVSMDDALSYPAVTHREYPEPVNNRMQSTIQPFVQKSVVVNKTLLSIFEEKLGLPRGRLLELHFNGDKSCSESRCIKNPSRLPMTLTEEEVAIGAHTDFGSLSFLHNRLGGLQVFVPGAESWQYIRPIPGHAVCNVGDALAILSGGILRSNLHRVVRPPGAQSKQDRWSLVFFTRPTNSTVLRALVEESTVIAQGVKDHHEQGGTLKFETGVTAAEWFQRRIRNQRVKNRTGPETWQASRGTEHRPSQV